MALRTLHPAGFLQGLFPSAQASLRPSIAAPLLERCRTAVLPSIWIPIPGIVSGLWEGILRAVPKKKTSHMKKRHRFMHNNKLKDVTALNKCSSCIQQWMKNGFNKLTGKGETGEPSEASGTNPQDGKVQTHPFPHPFPQSSPANPPQSRQYLQTHTVPSAHPTDIFSLAATPTHLLSASGSSSLKIHSTTASNPDDPNPYPLAQTLQNAHKLGAHHICASGDGKTAASAGFGGEIKVWELSEGEGEGWVEKGKIVDDVKAGELWAIALSQDGRYLAGTTYDGRVNVWDTNTLTSGEGGAEKIREYETKGSFGLSVALSSDGELTASGHANGSVYIFNNSTGRLAHSLQGLVKPVRTVAFSPACKFLAAGGDSKIIALYDVQNGEQVANLSGSNSWIMSLDWSSSGEWLLSGAYDGKAKVWSVERRECVATQTESDKTLWAVKWLPKTAAMRNETFATAGANQSISFYREASGS
ncbi:Ski complex subunit Rec14 [Zalaria obscura]|uniref:Ski complex subunit Rec14 n=1 Tax=Zalaria obscura TaxID=2024903 RepID=A0ACC3SJY7_9PEZI